MGHWRCSVDVECGVLTVVERAGRAWIIGESFDSTAWNWKVGDMMYRTRRIEIHVHVEKFRGMGSFHLKALSSFGQQRRLVKQY